MYVFLFKLVVRPSGIVERREGMSSKEGFSKQVGEWLKRIKTLFGKVIGFLKRYLLLVLQKYSAVFLYGFPWKARLLLQLKRCLFLLEGRSKIMRVPEQGDCEAAFEIYEAYSSLVFNNIRQTQR